MDFTPATTIAGIAKELKVSRPTIYKKLEILKLTPEDVLTDNYNALKLYASLDTKYLVTLTDVLRKPSVGLEGAKPASTPADRLNRITISRFAKQSGIPVKEIDRVLLAMIVGSYKNPVEAYKRLRRDKLVVDACNASGITPAQLSNFIKRKT